MPSIEAILAGSSGIPGEPLTTARNTRAPDFIVRGETAAALFTLTIYRGEGKCLLAMNWKQDMPPDNFAGFAVEYRNPGSDQYNSIRNRFSFQENTGSVDLNILNSRLSPIQKFRWIHFPNPGLPGLYTYRVTPVFMDEHGGLTYGESQTAAIELIAETYPGQLNCCFNRGLNGSTSFVDRFGSNGAFEGILPHSAGAGLDFKPTHPDAEAALAWKGYETRMAILNALDQAANDPSAQAMVAVCDCNNMEIITRLQKLGRRLKIIIDDSKSRHSTVAEDRTAALLAATAGGGNVRRQHMGNRQNNKMIVITGNKINIAISGSVNLSWHGLYVESNNALIFYGAAAVKIFADAFNNLWNNSNNPSAFANSRSAGWNDLQLTGINAKVTFSPHSASNAVLNSVATDITTTQSSLFYSLSVIHQTPGPMTHAIGHVLDNDQLFTYGISDGSTSSLHLKLPYESAPVQLPFAMLFSHLPQPFKAEASGGNSLVNSCKFVVIDFNKPTARVYTGSYNFTNASDVKNSESLFCIQDQAVATSYMIEAVAMFDHYAYRNAAIDPRSAKELYLKKPPASRAERPWWNKYWSSPQKALERELFAG